MDYDHFIREVHTRAHLDSNEKAVTAIRATLETLAERILPTEAADLAVQLPREIAHYLLESRNAPERFSPGEFVKRMALRENCDLDKATFHAQCVLNVLHEAISPGEFRDLLAELPAEFEPLFTAGSDKRA